VLRALFHHERADFNRAGEGDVVDVRMRDERGAGLLAVAGDAVAGAGRKARVEEQLAEREGGQRRFLRRLEDNGVAGRQCRRDAAGCDLQWIVPGDDDSAHPVRLEHRPVDEPVAKWNAAPKELVGETRVELEVARGDAHVDACLADRLSGVLALESGERLEAVEQELACSC
jgi:hypothetical protein